MLLGENLFPHLLAVNEKSAFFQNGASAIGHIALS
jgi:hypothetical protein